MLALYFGFEDQLSPHTFPPTSCYEASRNSTAVRASAQDLPASFGTHPQITLGRVVIIISYFNPVVLLNLQCYYLHISAVPIFAPEVLAINFQLRVTHAFEVNH